VYWADVFKNWEADCPKPVKKVATKRKTTAKKSSEGRRKMSNEIEKEIVKQAIKEWLNEKLAQLVGFPLEHFMFLSLVLATRYLSNSWLVYTKMILETIIGALVPVRRRRH